MPLEMKDASGGTEVDVPLLVVMVVLAGLRASAHDLRMVIGQVLS